MKMKVYDDYVLVDIVRNGESMAVPFRDIEEGDYITELEIYAGDDAHESGDCDYDGWVFYDTEGEGWFPEDLGGELIYDPDEDEDDEDEDDEWY